MADNPGGLPRIPPDVAESIVAEYKAGKGANTVAALHGVSKRTVYNVLVRAGVGTRPVHDRTGDGYHIPKGILAGVTPTGGKRGGQKGVLKHTLNEAAFDTLTDEAAYWIGFLTADGCIHQPAGGRQKNLFLLLGEKDREHLERFRTFLGSSHAIVTGKHRDPAGNVQGSVSLHVTSDRICARLEAWGMKQRKSLRETVHPELRSNRHFWRGCVDGDGSVYSERDKLYLCGGLEIVSEWSRWCEEVTGRRARVWKHASEYGSKGCWVGDIWAGAARTMLRHLYRVGDVALARKAAAAVRTG